MEHLFVGIDLGTSGIRTLVVDEIGQIHAKASCPVQGERRNGLHRQNPVEWWDAVCSTVSACISQLKRCGALTSQLRGVAIDGTSGTVVPTDHDGKCTDLAIMYDDISGRRFLTELSSTHSTAVLSLSALGTAYWLKDDDSRPSSPQLLPQATWVCRQLVGSAVPADYSNALKFGYDLGRNQYYAWINPAICVQLPAVVEPGTILGKLCRKASEQTQLPEGLPLVAGTTDGVASCIASGLRRPGDYSTSLGSTLVFKSLSEHRSSHPLLYSHKLPGGYWLPGAASNTGASWIKAWFPDADLPRMDAEALRYLPSKDTVYPLTLEGERFPFANSRAHAILPPGLSSARKFAACLQGTACLERMAYTLLDEALGVPLGQGEVYSTGGGSYSDIWMQLRADLCQRVYHRPACTEAAFGAAILAAAAIRYSTLPEAIQRMTHQSKTFKPHCELEEAYADFVRRIQPYLSS
jgi:sugar (pentulose or hexulose) kinase